jgi:hypothetical protein
MGEIPMRKSNGFLCGRYSPLIHKRETPRGNSVVLLAVTKTKKLSALPA